MDVQPGVAIFVDFIVALILIFSFIGGLKEGAVKEFFSLIALIIALPLAGFFYGYLSSWLTFMQDSDWRNIIAFLLMTGIITVILIFIFILPRHLLDKIWSGGCIWSIAGGLIGLVNSAVGLVVLVTLVEANPNAGWARDITLASNILNWLISNLNPVVQLLPEALR
ncbi:MAG: CvpA family protein [Dehalococcoidia bacterium]|nr:CvpA family protein [Dehalococcoidia bacterium]MDD5495290.1 CvpA family protein [Dehalococcoidia bacterium]